MTRQKRKQKYSKIIGITVIALIFLFVAQAYLLGPDKVIGKGVIKYLPLPAVMVNADAVLLGDYYQRLDIAKKLDPNFNRKDVLQQMINNQITELTAKNKKIVVNNQELDQNYEDLQRISNKQKLGADYGLSEEQFKKTILLPEVYQVSLQKWLASNKSLNDSAYKKLDAVKEKLSKNSSSSVASEYSEDAKSAQIGGDLGFVSYNDLVPELYDQLSEIKDKNAHVLISRFGIHVVQVTERDSKGPQGSTRYHLKQVFLKTTDYQKWFDKQRNYFSVLKFVY